MKERYRFLKLPPVKNDVVRLRQHCNEFLTTFNCIIKRIREVTCMLMRF